MVNCRPKAKLAEGSFKTFTSHFSYEPVHNFIPLDWRVSNKAVLHQNSPDSAAKAAFKEEMLLAFLTSITKQVN
jgi:hypothetical protein